MPRYKVTFVDGTEITLEREHGDDAKRDARLKRAHDTGAKERTDPRIKVASVERLVPKGRGERGDQSRDAGDAGNGDT